MNPLFALQSALQQQAPPSFFACGRGLLHVGFADSTKRGVPALFLLSLRCQSAVGQPLLRAHSGREDSAPRLRPSTLAVSDAMSYEPPSLAPLTITPEMAAMAQRNASQPAPTLTPSDFAMPPEADPPSVPGSDPDPGVGQLAEMFPDYDKEVIASVLSMCGNDVGSAMEQLLEMGGGGDGGGGGGGPVPSASGMDADEELAMALFHQFASAATFPHRHSAVAVLPAPPPGPCARSRESMLALAAARRRAVCVLSRASRAHRCPACAPLCVRLPPPACLASLVRRAPPPSRALAAFARSPLRSHLLHSQARWRSRCARRSGRSTLRSRPIRSATRSL